MLPYPEEPRPPSVWAFLAASVLVVLIGLVPLVSLSTRRVAEAAAEPAGKAVAAEVDRRIRSGTPPLEALSGALSGLPSGGPKASSTATTTETAAPPAETVPTEEMVLAEINKLDPERFQKPLTAIFQAELRRENGDLRLVIGNNRSAFRAQHSVDPKTTYDVSDDVALARGVAYQAFGLKEPRDLIESDFATYFRQAGSPASAVNGLARNAFVALQDLLRR